MKYGLICGAILWLGAAWLFRLPLEAVILLFVPLVLMRPALERVEAAAGEAPERRMVRLARWMQLPAAALLAGGFAFSQGVAAAALALPWLGVTLVLAAGGFAWLWRNKLRLDGDLAIGAALLLVAVGGVWVVISRAGARPQDFSHTIVLLTAVHFHYAGFALPLLGGVTVNSLNVNRPPRFVDRLMLLSIVAGVPLVGVGISLSPHVEVAAAAMLTTGCVLLAARQMQLAIRSRQPGPLTMLTVSSLALLSAMVSRSDLRVGRVHGHDVDRYSRNDPDTRRIQCVWICGVRFGRAYPADDYHN